MLIIAGKRTQQEKGQSIDQHAIIHVKMFVLNPLFGTFQAAHNDSAGQTQMQEFRLKMRHYG